MASLPEIVCGSERIVRSAWRAERKRAWWAQHREASLNWLALGLLLAAWNASGNDSASQMRRRPQALRGYPSVSVRAATLHAADLRRLRRIHESVNKP
ncbi:MAG TPA: hypothetical protein VGO37_04390 [Steroidobacteraceae bacterium]|jgi:hypothetical protein|nr:hypothetical protein [Steroidobacteraceae bacterium]